jgi:glycosyltransferase involved in cell wall biosynthesis
VVIIKVLHIISGNDNGGGANHILNICSNSQGMFQNVIGCVDEGYFYERLKNNDIETVLFNKKDIWKISKFVHENSIDIIDFHGPKPFLIHSLLKYIDVPCAATIHSDYRYDFLNSKLKKLIFTPLSIHGLKSFRYYICVSEYIRDVLEENGFNGYKTVVYNGIDVNTIKVSIERKALRDQLNISEDDFVFTCVARMHPIKNHSSLLRAFAKLKSEHENVKLLLVGDGPLEEELKELAQKLNISKDIIFTGYKSNPADYMNAGDITILTSFSEGGAPPVVILESAAVKKCVICSRVGDMDKFLDPGIEYLVDANSIEDIYLKMKEAYENKETLPNLGEKLYCMCKKKFSVKSFCTRYYDFYCKMLSK